MSHSPKNDRGLSRTRKADTRTPEREDLAYFRYLAEMELDLEALTAARTHLIWLAGREVIRDARLLRGVWRATLINGLLIAITKPTCASDLERKMQALMREADVFIPDEAGDLFAFALTEDALHIGVQNVPKLPPILFPRRRKR